MSGPVFANSALVWAPERFVLGDGAWRRAPLWVRYGLWPEAPGGPLLIDTGYTHHALTGGGAALRLYGRVLAPRLMPEAQPGAFLSAFGLRPADIATVVVSHFHADHVSGLALFPRAQFLASGAAWEAIRRRSALANHLRGIFPELLPPDFAHRLTPIETRPELRVDPLGLTARDLLGDGTLLALDLPGHAEGHFGLLFPRLARPLLYAVDVQWRLAALDPMRRPGLPARLIAEDRAALGRSSDLVRRLGQEGTEVLLCHDPSPAQHDWQGPRSHVSLA